MILAPATEVLPRPAPSAGSVLSLPRAGAAPTVRRVGRGGGRGLAPRGRGRGILARERDGLRPCGGALGTDAGRVVYPCVFGFSSGLDGIFGLLRSRVWFTPPQSGRRSRRPASADRLPLPGPLEVSGGGRGRGRWTGR